MMKVNFVSLFCNIRSQILKQSQPLTRICQSGFNPCRVCGQKQISHLAVSKSTPILHKQNVNMATMSPLPGSFQTSHLFNQSFREKLLGYGIQIPSNYTRKQLDLAAKVLLNSLYMKVPYKTLREVAGLEDSFKMWLKILFIHLWFLVCQLYKGGTDGEIIIHKMLKMLWDDLSVRLESFQEELHEYLKPKRHLRESGQEMITVFLLLDEGILSGDAMLASALWTLIYSLNSYAAEIWHLENLVHYIRLTTAKMQDISFETFVLRHEQLDWDFPEDLLDLVKKENQTWA